MAVGQKWVPVLGTLVNGKMDQNLRSPGGLILTHTHMNPHGFNDELNPRSKDKVHVLLLILPGGVGVSQSACFGCAARLPTLLLRPHSA